MKEATRMCLLRLYGRESQPALLTPPLKPPPPKKHARTPRHQILDDALTRPGRLDRIVRVELPDRTGREAILRVHARKVPLAPGKDGGVVLEVVNEGVGVSLSRGS